MSKKVNIRASAAQIICQVMDNGQSLTDALKEHSANVDSKDIGMIKEMCFGVVRYFTFYDAILQQLLSKKLKGKQRLYHHLMLVGIYQLDRMRVAEHAAVAETVSATSQLGAAGLKGLVNAVLRNFIRQRESLTAKAVLADKHQSHPSWLSTRIQQAYPHGYQAVLEANNQQAPMWIRVQTSNVSIEAFCLALKNADIDFVQDSIHATAIRLLTPCNVGQLPGFELGWFVVQDYSAQQAAHLLVCQDGERVLDACAAPGGKTCHILDLANVSMLAVDSDFMRAKRIEENLHRLKLSADVACLDISDSSKTAELEQFDKILLDVPCSATGVIRRHPDIKWLRRNSDIDELVALQHKILTNVWPLLKVNGTLLYATCSVLPDENQRQMVRFLAENDNAQLSAINESDNIDSPGWQLLPEQNHGDGFYYCRIIKTAKQAH